MELKKDGLGGGGVPGLVKGNSCSCTARLHDDEILKQNQDLLPESNQLVSAETQKNIRTDYFSTFEKHTG